MLNITSLIFYNFLNMRTKSKHRQEALKKSLSQLLQIQKKYLPLQPQSREIATIKWNDGALVQLVRIHACHAWGHGFESRTHRIKHWFSIFYKTSTQFYTRKCKVGCLFWIWILLSRNEFFLQRWIIQERGEFLPLGNGCKCHCLNDSPNNQSDFSNADVAM